MVCWFLILGALVAADDAPLRVRSLSVKERSKLPALKAAVRLDQPFAFGRAGAKLVLSPDGEGFVLGVAGSDGTVRAEPGKAVEIALGGSGGDEAHVALFRGDVDAGEPELWLLNLDVVDGRIGPVNVVFHDGDGNGRYFDPFVDFLSEKGGRLYPVSHTVVVSGTVHSPTYDEAARTVTSVPARDFIDPEIFPLWGDVVKGLAYINDVRGRMGLVPFGLDKDSSRRAMLHANYCVRNGVFQHEEEPDKPGYTTDGMRAGMRSIGSQMGGVSASIEEFLSTLLHRIPLIDARLREIGIAANGSQVWIETESGEKRPWIRQGPVVFPGPDGAWHDGAMAMERPDPRPKGVTAAVGLPVTVGFYGDEEPTGLRATLYLGKQPVECWRLDGEVKDLDPSHYDRIKAVLMPKKTLGHKTYRLEMTWRHDGRDRKLSRAVTIGN